MSGHGIILVGLGARSRLWRRVIAASPRAHLAALIDTDPLRRAEAARDHPDVRVAATLDAATGDAVLLCTPPAGREPQIAAACAAGLPILAEKPLATSLAEAAAHVAACQAAGVSLMVGLNFRYLAVTRALKALFADRLGPPAFARFTYERLRDGRAPGLNRYPLVMDQPMLWEQSVHHFDLMRHVYGADAVSLSARTFNPPWSMYAGPANVAATIGFETGVEVSYLGTWAGNRAGLDFHWRTDCAEGVAVQADMFGDLTFALRDDPRPTPVELGPVEPWTDDAAALLDAFLDHLDGAPLACSGADHLATLAMVEAARLSSETGQTIDPGRLKAEAERQIRDSLTLNVLTEKGNVR